MRRVSAQVTIVAASAETLDGLQDYLSRAGLGAHGTRELAGAGCEPCSVVVLFPDEFAPEEVLAELRRLRREQPSVVPLVVTGEPDRYTSIADGDGTAQAPIVFVRPTWGWTILEAIRAALGPRTDP